MTKNKQKDWGKLADEDLADQPTASADRQSSETLLEHPDYSELEEKLTKAEQLAELKTDECLRLQAEMQNLHRRARLDVENAHKFGVEKLVKELIEVVDNLERSNQSLHELPEQFDQLRTGIELTSKMFLDSLAKFGVKQIDPIKQPFDPRLHEAVSMMPATDIAPNHVMQVLQKGYTLHDRVVRPAMVIVAK